MLEDGLVLESEQFNEEYCQDFINEADYDDISFSDEEEMDEISTLLD